MAADFTVANHGSIMILTPQNDSAKDFIHERLPDDAQTWGRDGIVVEPRYIGNIVNDLQENGFGVEEG
jgi:hypothetical protein